MDTTARDAFAARLAGANRLVELAVGTRTDLAAILAARGIEIRVTDIRERAVPSNVEFVRDDLTDPDTTVYADADALYARNLPAELQSPARDLARTIDTPLWFTTLGMEEPVIPVDREVIPGDTLFRV
ncbi:MAG: UPF0146 family protein [Salinirussus sp.]